MAIQSLFIIVVVLAVLLIVGVPISYSIGISSLIAILQTVPLDVSVITGAQRIFVGMSKFSLTAIPFFILAGNLMNQGGIAKRLVDFVMALLGKLPGALLVTNVGANALFGAISGSASAAAAAVGSMVEEGEEEQGYDKALCAATNGASAPSGLLIPPSNALITYSLAAGGTSVAALFLAGYVPGILMGLVTMVIAFFYAKKHNYSVSEKVPMKDAIRITLDALPSLLLIVIVIGGIVGGIFTATEGAGIAVLYCAILSLIYRSVDFKTLMKILLDSANTSGIILFLIAASSAMSWVMAYTGIPNAISTAIMSVSTNKYVILLLMNVVLLIVGTFLDITPACLIFTPIFLPIVTSLGMDLVQFGVVLTFNMCLGTMTPPVGSVLFVSCGISKLPIEKVIRTLLPYVGAQIILLLLVTYIPAISMALPTAMGLV